MTATDYDFVVIGGGFYGCCLALFLRSLSPKVLLLERSEDILTRASRVNQARLHSGFHYPRSALTAVKSGILFNKFVEDWPSAVVDDFDMLYAIGKRGSKISAKRFKKIFEDIGSEIREAAGFDRTLFDEDYIDGVFHCKEYAFDYTVFVEILKDKLKSSGVKTRLNTEAVNVAIENEFCKIDLDTGSSLTAGYVFNVTYSHINELHKKADIPLVQTRHELTELALVKVPNEFEGKAVTVMDGPFFSCMPYPSTPFHSLTHVRYTPHGTWLDSDTTLSPYEVFESLPKHSKFEFMRRDASRFMPCLKDLEYQRSEFEVKTVLTGNDRDDGRPILFSKDPKAGRLYSILGGKIDNIYDLFEVMRIENPLWKDADDAYLF